MKDMLLPENLLRDSKFKKNLHYPSRIFREIQHCTILLGQANYFWNFFYESIAFNSKGFANINVKKLKSILFNSKSYPSLNNIWEGIEWKI